mmetsp:Transcript_27690/g.89463  ORF Transcript_27690/g.89463 Transcript_27690/m.89463 type:complete len:300 (-) Transcript_27690:269-1168(-)|eukprot:scaffold11596_cov128-Isochrysis_galbana.AAC.4
MFSLAAVLALPLLASGYMVLATPRGVAPLARAAVGAPRARTPVAFFEPDAFLDANALRPAGDVRSLLAPSAEARASFVRGVLAAPQLAPSLDGGLELPRWLSSAVATTACAAAFPHTFSAVQQWHGQRAWAASWELARASRLVDRLLSKELPPGSYRIESRVKSVSSLFEKVWLRGKVAHDLLALRVVLVDVPREAYAISPADGTHRRCLEARELLTRRWEETALRDYIARPKQNGYASLHSHLKLDSGATLEVQIRTETMHAAAERGTAAHAQYKVAAMESAAGRTGLRNGAGALAAH